MSTAVILGIIGAIYLIFYLAYKLDESEHFILRFSLITFGIILFPVLGNMILQISDGTVLENMGVTFLKYTIYLQRFYFTYITFYIVYVLFNVMGIMPQIADKFNKAKIKLGIGKKW